MGVLNSLAMKNLFGRNWVIGGKARFFLLCGVLAAVCIFFLDYRNGFDSEGVLVEAHGMLFDIILFGVILSIYEFYTERKRKQEAEAMEKKIRIQRYREEIEDYLGWESDEAKFRIVGNIKRLNREGVTDINLRGAYLVEANLHKLNFYEADLEGVNLIGANLTKADLGKANLYNSSLSKANLSSAKLYRAFLEGAFIQQTDFTEANLEEAIFYKADLSYSCLSRSSLHNANLEGANLRNAYFRGADLQGTNLIQASLKGSNLLLANLNRADLLYADLRGAIIKYERIKGQDPEIATFKGANLIGAKAYESQKDSFLEAGADISQMEFVPDPEEGGEELGGRD